MQTNTTTTTTSRTTTPHTQAGNAHGQTQATLPVGAQPLNVNGFRLLVEWGGEIFRTGVIISLPIIAALLIANVAVGIMTRAAPQLNIFAVGFPVTLAVGFFALWISVPFVGPSVQKLFDQAILIAMQIVKQLAAPL